MTRALPGRETALLLTLGLMWGSSFLFTKIGLRELGPITVVTLRMGGSLLVLLAAVFLTGQRMPRPGPIWVPFGVMSVFSGVLPYFLTTWGMVTIDSGLAAILMSTAPLFTLLLAHVCTEDERITPMGLLGVLLGMAGVALLIGPDALGGISRNVAGQLAVIGAVCCYAVALVYGRRLRDVPATISAAGMQVWSTLILLPIQAWLEPPWWKLGPSVETMLALAALAVLSTALPYLVYYRLLGLAGASRTSLVNYLIPLVGVGWGVLLLGERLPLRALPALLLILAGVGAVTGHLPALLRRVLRPTAEAA